MSGRRKAKPSGPSPMREAVKKNPIEVECGGCGGRAQILPFFKPKPGPANSLVVCLDGCSSSTPRKVVDHPGAAVDMATAAAPAEGWCDCELCIARWGTAVAS